MINKEKIKNFIKENKNEIFLATGSFILGMWANHNILINQQPKNHFRVEMDNSIPGFKKGERINNSGWIKTTLYNCKVSDLGKLGKQLEKTYPNIINSSTKIDLATINYTIFTKSCV